MRYLEKTRRLLKFLTLSNVKQKQDQKIIALTYYDT